MGVSIFLLFSRFLLFFYSVLSLAVLALSDADDVYYEYKCSENGGKYAGNSTYQANLNRIISQFSLTPFNYGFFNLSAGESPDKVYTIALCRGDLDQQKCNSCLNYTSTKLERYCPSYKEAIAWSELCLVRYANRDLYGQLESLPPRTCAFNPENASNPIKFNRALSDLLINLTSQAASGGPLRKYAAGKTEADSLETIYATVQCTPDMGERNCTACLTFAKDELRKCCAGRLGCRVLRATCIFRFENNNLFYDNIAVPLPPPPTARTPTTTSPLI